MCYVNKIILKEIIVILNRLFKLSGGSLRNIVNYLQMFLIENSRYYKFLKKTLKLNQNKLN
jgi:hypothetical protein